MNSDASFRLLQQAANGILVTLGVIADNGSEALDVQGNVREFKRYVFGPRYENAENRLNEITFIYSDPSSRINDYAEIKKIIERYPSIRHLTAMTVDKDENGRAGEVHEVMAIKTSDLHKVMSLAVKNNLKLTYTNADNPENLLRPIVDKDKGEYKKDLYQRVATPTDFRTTKNGIEGNLTNIMLFKVDPYAVERMGETPDKAMARGLKIFDYGKVMYKGGMEVHAQYVYQKLPNKTYNIYLCVQGMLGKDGKFNEDVVKDINGRVERLNEEVRKQTMTRIEKIEKYGLYEVAREERTMLTAIPIKRTGDKEIDNATIFELRRRLHRAGLGIADYEIKYNPMTNKRTLFCSILSTSKAIKAIYDINLRPLVFGKEDADRDIKERAQNRRDLYIVNKESKDAYVVRDADNPSKLALVVSPEGVAFVDREGRARVLATNDTRDKIARAVSLMSAPAIKKLPAVKNKTYAEYAREYTDNALKQARVGIAFRDAESAQAANGKDAEGLVAVARVSSELARVTTETIGRSMYKSELNGAVKEAFGQLTEAERETLAEVLSSEKLNDALVRARYITFNDKNNNGIDDREEEQDIIDDKAKEEERDLDLGDEENRGLESGLDVGEGEDYPG